MDFLFVAVDLSLFFFDGHTAFFEIGKKIFEVFIIFTDAGFGIFDEVFAKTKFFRDRKGITFSRNTD